MFQPIGLLNITIAREYGVHPGSVVYLMDSSAMSMQYEKPALLDISYGSTTRRIKCFSEFG